MHKTLLALALSAIAAQATAQGLEEVDKPFRAKAKAEAGLPVAPYTPAAKPPAPYALAAEALLDEQLAAWAERAGWTFRWYADRTWRVIAPSAYGTDFERAFSEVMDILINDEGKALRFAISRGNKVVEVYANDLQ